MSKHITIYHNPRCSKSRETLALLQQQGRQPEVVRYLDTPPDHATLTRLLHQLGMKSARELMRKQEALYRQLNLADASLTEAELIQALADNPSLIERPIVVVGQQARIGRPPEQVLAML